MPILVTGGEGVSPWVPGRERERGRLPSPGRQAAGAGQAGRTPAATPVLRTALPEADTPNESDVRQERNLRSRRQPSCAPGTWTYTTTNPVLTYLGRTP